MGFIPHRPIHLAEIRITDIWVLLLVGGLFELINRVFLLSLKQKPASLLKKEDELYALQTKTESKRQMGPSAFVETSKLERQVLALEKELSTLLECRKETLKTWESSMKTNNMKLAVVVWFLYFSVPLITLDDVQMASGPYSSGGTLLNNLFFPLSYSGFGYRLANYGLPAEAAMDSLGALLVMWSAQTTVVKIMDGVDAYYTL